MLHLLFQEELNNEAFAVVQEYTRRLRESCTDATVRALRLAPLTPPPTMAAGGSGSVVAARSRGESVPENEDGKGGDEAEDATTAHVSYPLSLEEMLVLLGDTIGVGAAAASRKVEKNYSVLLVAADVCHALGGGRVTSCKSAKDRTSMSLTLEQARLLPAYGMKPEMTRWAANLMREKVSAAASASSRTSATTPTA